MFLMTILITIFPRQNLSEKSGSVSHFANLSDTGLIEDDWIFVSASAFCLLWCVALVEVNEENPGLHGYM